MNQCTERNEMTNDAIKRAINAGEIWFDRSNSNRWYAMKGEVIIFGGGHVRRNLTECKAFADGYKYNRRANPNRPTISLDERNRVNAARVAAM